MGKRKSPLLNRLRARLRPALAGPHLLAFLPAVTLGSFWMGGEGALTVVALGIPMLFALGGISYTPFERPELYDMSTVTGPERAQALVESYLQVAAERGRRTAAYMIELDDAKLLAARHGQTAADLILARTGDRLQSCLRDVDLVRRVGEARFLVTLDPVRRLTLDTCVGIAARLQRALEDPISIDATAVPVSCSIGFCISNRSPNDSAEALIGAARTALAEARRHGAGSLRGFSEDIREESDVQAVFAEEILTAMEQGQFAPWFQPQISTDTGRITGFEALARWVHPQKGLIPPVEFLPTVTEMGKIERLGEIMLSRALGALRKWDEAGFDVPTVAVNFSDAELRNPALLDRVKWELDRFDLAPHRLVVEVLESVVAASPDDATARNINALARLGCVIDLDDFGTGQASISAVRRFAVSRLKIDRSFVMKADRDPDQQRMIAAILTMSEQLGLATVGEGVETKGEHAMLAQLGCDHVQGFGIARPMPLEDTMEWIAQHEAALQATPRIGRAAG